MIWRNCSAPWRRRGHSLVSGRGEDRRTGCRRSNAIRVNRLSCGFELARWIFTAPITIRPRNRNEHIYRFSSIFSPHPSNPFFFLPWGNFSLPPDFPLAITPFHAGSRAADFVRSAISRWREDPIIIPCAIERSSPVLPIFPPGE